MKAKITRLDAHYEVRFGRPAFSRITTFSQIIEPIYDVFSKELLIPSDGIKVYGGNSIDTTTVVLTLDSGLSQYEARLDGYKTTFIDLRDIDRAKRHASFFEAAVSKFLTDGTPCLWKLKIPCWIAINDLGATEIVEDLLRGLAWNSKSNDPFAIGAARTHSSVQFDCCNEAELWTVKISLSSSVLPDSHLFIEFSGEYKVGSKIIYVNKISDHLHGVIDTVLERLDLEQVD